MAASGVGRRRFLQAAMASGLALSDGHRPARATENAVSGASAAEAGQPSAPGPIQPAAYLFAHMTREDYGRLYYSVSRDGLRWRLLNGGRRISDEYRGHPDITCGHDGRFYLIGNRARDPQIRIWVSADLVRWSHLRDFRPDITKTPDFKPALRYHGAPKMLYDAPSGRYVITWHSTCRKPLKEKPEWFWSGMRTLYVTTPDLVHVSGPRRLFAFDVATIDVVIRREGNRYWAVLKDERYPSFDWPTGKTIRLASAPHPTGPFGDPGRPVTPNFREAPTVIPRPDGRGWYLYYEQYPGLAYGCSTAPSLAGAWYALYAKDYAVPESARHGCMIPITETQHEAIVGAYGQETRAGE